MTYKMIVFNEEGDVVLDETVSEVSKGLINRSVTKKKYSDNRKVTKLTGLRTLFMDRALLEVISKLKYFELKVLIYFICNMEFDNWCYINNGMIAEYFKVSKEQISRSVNVLTKLGYLEEHKKKGIIVERYFRVSPLIAYKGRFDDWKQVLLENDDNEFQEQMIKIFGKKED